jgi:hypothetical protein
LGARSLSLSLSLSRSLGGALLGEFIYTNI